MSRPWRLAILGADSPVGESLLAELAEQDWAPQAILPVSLGEADSAVTWQGEDWPCQPVDGVDWTAAEALAVALQGPAAQRALATLPLSELPLVVIGSGLTTAGQAPVIEVAEAAAEAIQRVLRALAAGGRIERLSGFIGLPVAALGREGVEELARQSRALFALEAIEVHAFPVQIAFNLNPQVGPIGQDGRSAYESALQRALSAAFGPGLVTQLTAAWVPTFHGAVADLHGLCQNLQSTDEIRARLRHVPGLMLMDAALPGAAPTPATDAVDSSEVAVGRLRLDPEGGFSLWLAFDYCRLQAHLLCAGLEKLIEFKPE
ncbi:MAG: Asd/ArgC dimerization domain-containing protein [Thiobacillaceae bacterium]|nr:Asd/ArgC dimerization domain-containing protein [Thiobacillaceae bacterium]MCX7673379.1 Asd/ArgC dimerization domain-containing protein [Thiobacillaceae bacterium]